MSAHEHIIAIAARRGLDPQHPADALAEAAAWKRRPGIQDPTLVDLTELPFVTIDEDQSKDLDQALFIERAGEQYRVWYAIADAAYYARPGSAVLTEAVVRGSSFYLPGLVIPLLPRLLSEDIVSLNPDVDRRALVFRVLLNPDGSVEQADIVRARVRSRLKTWYDAVQSWYDGEGELPCDEAVKESLRLLAEVGELRIDAAAARNVVRYRRTQLSVHLHGESQRFIALGDPRNDCELYNEQISLLCNMEGARLLGQPAGPHVQPIFRAHAGPEPRRLDQLSAQIEAMVKIHRLDPLVWRWDRTRAGLRRWLDRLPKEGPEGRVAAAIHRQAMIASGRAVLQTTPDPHYGVGAAEYGRFTAPMREVVGIFTHKETWEHLGAKPEPDADDHRLREQILQAALGSRRIQRELDREVNRLVLDQLFEDDLSAPEAPLRLGTAMGVRRGKVHVRLDDPPIDVKVYARHIEKHLGVAVFEPRNGIMLRRKKGGSAVVTVGDAVTVEVRGRDRETDRWELRLRRSS